LPNAGTSLWQKPQKRNLKVKRRALHWKRTTVREMSTNSWQNTKNCELFFSKLGKKFHFVAEPKRQPSVITINI